MEPSGGTIMISDRVVKYEFFRHIAQFKIKRVLPEESLNPADIIFPDCNPALAVAILDFKIDKRPIDEVMNQLEAIQKKFKSAFAIIYNHDSKIWTYIQVNLKGGPLRVLGSSNCIDSAECLMDIYTDLKCKRKLLMQREFFVNEEMKLTAPETAEEIAYKSFEKLGISQYDGSIVLDGFPTLKKLITTSKEEMSDNSPADQKSIEKLTNFFSAKY